MNYKSTLWSPEPWCPRWGPLRFPRRRASGLPFITGHAILLEQAAARYCTEGLQIGVALDYLAAAHTLSPRSRKKAKRDYEPRTCSTHAMNAAHSCSGTTSP